MIDPRLYPGTDLTVAERAVSAYRLQMLKWAQQKGGDAQNLETFVMHSRWVSAADAEKMYPPKGKEDDSAVSAAAVDLEWRMHIGSFRFVPVMPHTTHYHGVPNEAAARICHDYRMKLLEFLPSTPGATSHLDQ